MAISPCNFLAIAMLIAVALPFAACSKSSHLIPPHGDNSRSTPANTSGISTISTDEADKLFIPQKPSDNEFPTFSVPTIDGKVILFEELVGTHPVYVIFVSDADNRLDRDQLSSAQAQIEQFENLGAKIIAITSDWPTDVMIMRDELELEFPVIADPFSVVSSDWRASGLMNSGDGGTASFIFDAHGSLVARSIADDKEDRPSILEVLRLIEESLETGSA